MKVVKIEGSAVKHGNWKYYDASSGLITKKETYFLDKIEDPFKSLMAESDGMVVDTLPGAKKPVATKAKPQAVLDFEKKNSGKKKVKVIDGRTF
jgi:hypothetical protein